MSITRRDLSLLLSALGLAVTEAAPEAEGATVQSQAYKFEDLPEKTNGKNKSWQVLDEDTVKGCRVDLHITQLAPGEMPHPPHSHVHEEMVLMEQGTLEVTISGKSSRIGPGSVAIVASNERHGWKNVGDTNARYFVLAFGRDKT